MNSNNIKYTALDILTLWVLLVIYGSGVSYGALFYTLTTSLFGSRPNAVLEIRYQHNVVTG